MSFFETHTGSLILIVSQCLLVMLSVLASLAFIMYGERKVWGLLQLRKGPNVVGPFGVFQSFADLFKHDYLTVILRSDRCWTRRY